ncbi:hypothetical protein [Brachybacterium kimchii]|uniref:Uncharacterized protein n=1 Tax=Brachybacterium kimchii TaxID=2942909 RepID=A0ABY4N9L3_9MICO|nr:hypothetical protein [Brachybacterium kimchii]UQN30487.1 hypothetical protein M4486_03855 [Brachybacterium kimchii]
MASTKIRKRDTGEAGNRGQFGTTARPEAAVSVPSPAPTRHGRTIDVGPEVSHLVTDVESTFDEDGRTVIHVQVDREHLPTSSYRVGSAPWDIDDEDVTDDQVDAYLESRSDNPEAFAYDLGFPGRARWNSPTSTLELTHEGFEGIDDDELSGTVSETLRDFGDDLRLHEWS